MLKKKLWLEGLVLVAIFGSLWGIFSIFTIGPKKPLWQISAEKETKLGYLLVKATLANPEFGEVDLDSVKLTLQVILDRLTQGPDTSQYTYQYLVVENDMANAFALPGGYLIVTTGLIAALQSPEEFAAVLAHEIGHIELRHTMAKLLANFTSAVLFSDEVLVTEAADMLATSAFSRRQEEKADTYALNLLTRCHINPHTMGTAFRHLKEEHSGYNPKMEIIMSHPDIDSRIRAAYCFPLPADFRQEKLGIQWSQIQNQVIQLKSQ
jgi:predicted Zn-dependent protease